MTANERRILIVEDEPQVAQILARILEPGWSRIATAGSVKEAEAALDADNFDIVILDRMLPDGDGVQILGKIRAYPALRNTPVLILSGKSRAEEQSEGLDLGADDCLTKPFDCAELRARVNALLRRASRFSR